MPQSNSNLCHLWNVTMQKSIHKNWGHIYISHPYKIWKVKLRCFISPLNPSGQYIYRKGKHYNSTFCPHSVFMCFVWIWEQTAIISLYSINWPVCVTETECVYCAVRTGSLYIILRSAHTVYLCVLCGSENKQRLFPYAALTDWCL